VRTGRDRADCPCTSRGDIVRWGGLQAILEVEQFSVRRAQGFAVELPHLSLLSGKVAALYGPSGCGKTTLLHGLFGLLRGADVHTQGAVRVLGRDFGTALLTERSHVMRHDLAFLAQDAHAALDPLQPIGQQIAQATLRSAADAAAQLANLGVQDAAAVCRRLPHQISGGQAQRVLLAIAFLRAPSLVIADEPSASLDGGSYGELLVHLRRLFDQGSAMLLATHDVRLLRDLDAAVYTATEGRFLPGKADTLAWPQRAEGAAIGSVPVLAARDLGVAYGERRVLDGADFRLHRGEIVAVIGESGAGKTTLARVLAGHRAPDRGTVDRPPRATAVQLCCQDAFASLTPGRSLASLVAEAKAPFFDLERAAATLRLARGAEHRSAGHLSGGERRRAALLRALAVQPDVLLLDEPTASLDRRAAIAVLESLLELQQSRGLAMVLVTHDHELAKAIAHRTVAVEDGKVIPC
jgi:peptide/nickel transport system ATP-binding protein